MPFAGFENFDACVLAMKAKGHSEEEARRMCGKIQADAEKKMADGSTSFTTGFENQWIEIFRLGDYGKKGNWDRPKIEQVIQNFKSKVWTPVAVLGHPEDDSPAFGWIKDLRLRGDLLDAQFEKVHPALEALVADGRYPNRSAAFYLDPQGRGPVLRHVGFLGAIPPEVKGLEPIHFSHREFLAFDFNQEEDKMDLKQIKEAVAEFFREKFTEGKPAPQFTEEQVQQRIEAVTKPLLESVQALTKKFDESVKKAEDRANASDAASRKAEVHAFIEKRKAANQWVPAFDEAGLPAVLEHLATTPGTIKFGEAGKEKEVTPYQVFSGFLEKLPIIVPMGDLAGPAHRASNVLTMPFNETKDLQVDPESVALNQRAEAIAADLRKQDPKLTELAAFKEALHRARAERGATAKAGGIAAGKA